MKSLAITLVLGLIGTTGILTLNHVVQADYRLYQSESACVAEYVADGYARKDITTGNGTCKITK